MCKASTHHTKSKKTKSSTDSVTVYRNIIWLNDALRITTNICVWSQRGRHTASFTKCIFGYLTHGFNVLCSNVEDEETPSLGVTSSRLAFFHPLHFFAKNRKETARIMTWKLLQLEMQTNENAWKWLTNYTAVACQCTNFIDFRDGKIHLFPFFATSRFLKSRIAWSWRGLSVFLEECQSEQKSKEEQHVLNQWRRGGSLTSHCLDD